jgi:hypothetical protein
MQHDPIQRRLKMPKNLAKPYSKWTLEEKREQMDEAMKKIAHIHARVGHTDWLIHQIYRFLFEGYPHHTGPLFRKLEKLSGNSQIVRGLRLVLDAEAKNPTPFSAMTPKNQLFRDWAAELRRDLDAEQRRSVVRSVKHLPLDETANDRIMPANDR